jgi:hypothetical protein
MPMPSSTSANSFSDRRASTRRLKRPPKWLPTPRPAMKAPTIIAIE